MKQLESLLSYEKIKKYSNTKSLFEFNPIFHFSYWLGEFGTNLNRLYEQHADLDWAFTVLLSLIFLYYFEDLKDNQKIVIIYNYSYRSNQVLNN